MPVWLATVGLVVVAAFAAPNALGHTSWSYVLPQATILAIADDIAAAAGLVMGKTNRAPVVIVRGLAWKGTGTGRDLIRPAAEDLFR